MRSSGTPPVQAVGLVAACSLIVAGCSLCFAGCQREDAGAAPWNTAPTRSTHDAKFPIAAGAHAVDCNDCHGAFDSFRQFDCTTCHDQPTTATRHAGNAAYVWASPQCYACHPRGLVGGAGTDPASHAGFPISTGTRHAYGGTVLVAGASTVISCSSCHVDVADRRNVDCTGCHVQGAQGTPLPGSPADQTTAHAGKLAPGAWLGTGPVGSDGKGASAQCLFCHAGAAQPAGFIARHATASPATKGAVFDISSASTAHFVACTSCHTQRLTVAPRQNPQLDDTRASCDGCHAASGADAIVARHTAFGVAVTGAYSAFDPDNSSACLSCHPNGGAAGNFSHAWFPIGAGTRHDATVARCADCHQDTTTYQGDPAANVARIRCTGCHDDSAANTKNQGGLTITAVHSAPHVGRDIWTVPGGKNYADNALCLKCHAGNIGGAVAGFSTPLVFRLAQHDTHCRMSDKGIASGDPTHNVNRNADNGVNTCFACHAATVGTGSTPWATDWARAEPATMCIACHQHTVSAAPRITCR